jgi:hypothetical protein
MHWNRDMFCSRFHSGLDRILTTLPPHTTLNTLPKLRSLTIHCKSTIGSMWISFKIHKHHNQPCTLHSEMYGLHSTPLAAYNLVITTTHYDHWIVEAINYIPLYCHAQLWTHWVELHHLHYTQTSPLVLPQYHSKLVITITNHAPR